MTEQMSKIEPSDDVQKAAVDELIRYCRLTKTAIPPNEIFEFYRKILNEKVTIYKAIDFEL